MLSKHRCGNTRKNLLFTPQRSCVTQQKTTKVFLIFDFSKSRSMYVFKALYSEPSLLCIFDILLRFRLHKYILLSDIKQAFLNVGVRTEDSDFLSFQFLRVLFGLICSPFLLNATIKVHRGQYLNISQDFVFEFLRNLYVDDSRLGFDFSAEGYGYF